MHANIYRFQIVRALSNAVYEVRDPGSGDVLTLYEWTPAIADREFAKRRLGELAEDLKLEIFTADASLYFVAATEAEALEALRELHGNNLFLDNRAIVASPQEPPAEPVNRGLAGLEDQDTQKGLVRVRAWYVAAAVLLMGGVILAAFVVRQGMQLAPAKSVVIEDSHPAYSRELQLAKSRESEAQTLAVAQSQRLNEFAGVRSLRVKNSSSQTYKVAVSFLGFNGLQQVQGWATVPPGKTQIVATSPSNQFYLFAKRKDGAVVTGSAKSMSVEDGDFVYYDGDDQPNMISVRPVAVLSGLSELR